MKFDTILQFLLPRNSHFYELFDHAAANVLESGRVFRAMLDAPADEQKSYQKQLEDLEHSGDDITHRIYNELSTTFVTPIDREDIHHLASNLDDVVDLIDSAATHIRLYNIRAFPQGVLDISDVLVKSIEEISRALPLLSDMRNETRIRQSCVRINSYENEADRINYTTIAGIFENETEPVQIIKIKDLMADLERATDKCETVANLMENILLKHA